MLLFSTTTKLPFSTTTKKQQQQMANILNSLNSESLKVGLNKDKEHNKLCRQCTNEDILIDQEKKMKSNRIQIPWTNHRDTTKEEIYARIRAAWSCFGKNKEMLQGRQLAGGWNRAVSRVFGSLPCVTQHRSFDPPLTLWWRESFPWSQHEF